MKFPSIIRLPRHRQFNIEPRYYDPVKEEIKERTERIKKELKGKETNFVPGRISFERKARPVPSSSFLQLLIAAILGVMIVGWLYYGNDVLYVLWLAVPVYLYLRLRKSSSRRKPSSGRS